MDETVVEAGPAPFDNTGEMNLVADQFEKRSLQSDSGSKLNYRLFKPEVEKGEEYPVVLFLHGAGERGTNSEVQLLANRGAIAWATEEQQSKHPSFVLAPQIPAEESWTSNKNQQLVIELLEAIKQEYLVDEDRIYITGTSIGGRGTWALIQNYPEWFAAAIPISGNGNPEKAESISQTSIWNFHAADDQIKPVSGSRKMMAALEETGGTVIKGVYAGDLENPAAEAAAQQLWDKARARESQLLYTEYPENTAPARPHYS